MTYQRAGGQSLYKNISDNFLRVCNKFPEIGFKSSTFLIETSLTKTRGYLFIYFGFENQQLWGSLYGRC